MNRMARSVVASGAGLALALTASPALAAPPSDSRSNGAQVEHFESPDGSLEYRQVIRHQSHDYSITNSRDREVLNGTSTDWKKHYIELENASNISSQITTTTEAGVTCRTNTRYVIANGKTRSEGTHSSC
ncbi:hypothetical protein QFZ36_003687 [Pseudarthrobacter siccitolerans]|uniref:Secreted protein n=1 Tax=Pseudarthrobacter siccitolerans TaxID=861266 RepID=A0ABU0PQB3_9MICC|nr:hypothetical protein [Pseudarthrobacter siccitolerans]MDQ0676126.1 hypothetical protein [Pseudarthrobacter siccitolerans]